MSTLLSFFVQLSSKASKVPLNDVGAAEKAAKIRATVATHWNALRMGHYGDFRKALLGNSVSALAESGLQIAARFNESHPLDPKMKQAGSSFWTLGSINYYHNSLECARRKEGLTSSLGQ